MNKNTISTMDKKIYFSEKCNLVLDANMVWDAASCATNVKCFFIYYYVVKVYNYVELEIKLKLLDFVLFDNTFS